MVVLGSVEPAADSRRSTNRIAIPAPMSRLERLNGPQFTSGPRPSSPWVPGRPLKTKTYVRTAPLTAKPGLKSYCVA